MRETILPKISGITLLCDSAPQTRAHTRAREPTLSLVLPFFVCRVGIAYLSIFVYLCFSLSLSRIHTPRSSVESPRYRGYTVGDVAEPVGEGGAPGDVTLPPFCLVTSTERHRATGRVPYSSVLPHWLLLLPQTGCRAGLPTSLFSIRDFGGISLWLFVFIGYLSNVF